MVDGVAKIGTAAQLGDNVPSDNPAPTNERNRATAERTELMCASAICSEQRNND